MKVTAETLPDGRVSVTVMPDSGSTYTIVGSPICELDMTPPELTDVTDFNIRELFTRPEPRFTLRLEHITEVRL